MSFCLLCQIDAMGTDEQTFRACYYAVAHFVDPNVCDEHRQSLIFAGNAVAALTGAAAFAVADMPRPPPRSPAQKPSPLRLVKP